MLGPITIASIILIIVTRVGSDWILKERRFIKDFRTYQMYGRIALIVGVIWVISIVVLVVCMAVFLLSFVL